VLERRGAALCLVDRKGMRTPRWRTANWGYVRFHEGRGSPASCYGRAALATWAGVIAEMWPGDQDVFAYFNNDAFGCALRDAIAFAHLSEACGLHATRVPAMREVSLGAA
jgi:uncharacterized protein YecE (DUF72 family)